MSRSSRVPPPLSPRAERYHPSRQPCPSCGCPDAEVLFQVARCLNQTCRNFDAALVVSGEAGAAAIRAWLALRRE